MVIYYRKGSNILGRKFDNFVPNAGVDVELDDVVYVVIRVMFRFNKNDVIIDLEDKS